MSEAKDVAQKLVVKNKLLFVFCISFIMVSLFMVCYLFFFRSITIDVTKDISVTYEGESGVASVVIHNEAYNLNQRTQEFLNSINYQVTPSRNISNGTKITIAASWSEELADKYNIQVINTEKEIVVEGLRQRYQNVEEIPDDFIALLNIRSETYFKRNMETILKKDFSDFYVTSNTELKENALVYRFFLQAMDKENKDKILDVYAMSATGKINQGVDHEDLIDGESTIYYSVLYDNVDDTQKVEDSDVYGEKLILPKEATADEVLASIKGKYLLSYSMSLIEN